MALPWGKSLQALLISGGVSGMVGELVNQVFDNTFSEDKKGYSLQRTLISGGIGAVANVIANGLVDKVNGLFDQQLAKQIAGTETSAYRELLKKSILEKTPRIGNSGLKKAINKELKAVQQLLRQQTEANKVAAKQTIERSVDYMSGKTNDVLLVPIQNGKNN
jgi:hypothetical protein